MTDQAWSVEFYTDGRGRSPARDYLRSLSVDEQAEAIRLLEMLESYWYYRNRQTSLG